MRQSGFGGEIEIFPVDITEAKIAFRLWFVVARRQLE